MAGLYIWAESIDTHSSTCSDARLRENKSDSVEYKKDTIFGQAGWEIGLRYENLKDLVFKLEQQTKSRKIERLAINAHGNHGIVYVGGNGNDDDALKLSTLMAYSALLERLKNIMQENATILFMSCLTGGGTAGDFLLANLSTGFFRGRTMVAFTTVGYQSGSQQTRHAAQCMNPGMRDTDRLFGSMTGVIEDKQYGPIWNDLHKLPWASEHSPHAKVYRNGEKIRSPTENEYKHLKWGEHNKDLMKLNMLWKKVIISGKAAKGKPPSSMDVWSWQQDVQFFNNEQLQVNKKGIFDGAPWDKPENKWLLNLPAGMSRL